MYVNTSKNFLHLQEGELKFYQIQAVSFRWLVHLRQVRQNAIVRESIGGGVPELADGPDLGSGAAMHGGSSPPFPTSGHFRKLACSSFCIVYYVLINSRTLFNHDLYLKY